LVETAIYVLLGFLAALLLALISVPAISRRAFRLAEARARLLAPASVEQARADLDALRGKHAIELTLVERRASVAADASAAAQIELGRRANEIFGRDKIISERDAEIQRQRDEISELLGDLRTSGTDNAALHIGLHDLTRQRDAASASNADAMKQVASHEARGEENRATIAMLETRLAALSIELADVKRKSEGAAERAKSRISELESYHEASRSHARSTAERLASLEATHAALKTEADGRGAEAARLRERLVELEPRLVSSESNREALSLESTRQSSRAAERVADLQRLVQLRREENESLNERLSTAAARENELTMRIQALTAARADAEGALRAARSENEAILQDLGIAREPRGAATKPSRAHANGDQMLRQAIIRLGRKLAKSGVAEIAGPGEAEIIAFNPRDAVIAFGAEEDRSKKAPHASEA
jgi:DNA repair exonuclease SbcCD ATPase subunit